MDDPLAHEPFSFAEQKNGSVRIFHKGKLATTLSARAGAKFLGRVDRLSDADRQQLMARATGQFKFGNEHQGRVQS